MPDEAAVVGELGVPGEGRADRRTPDRNVEGGGAAAGDERKVGAGRTGNAVGALLDEGQRETRVVDAEGGVDSGEVGAAKPDPAFWEAALAAAGCRPGECVYADDRPELVAAASAIGVPGFVVDGPASLARGLARFDLLDAPTTASGNSPAATDVPRR